VHPEMADPIAWTRHGALLVLVVGSATRLRPRDHATDRSMTMPSSIKLAHFAAGW
jgi:hypothetical protein